jgi:hypothetical protein
MAQLDPDLEEARKKLELFDLQKPLGLLDWQEAGQASVSSAALDNAKAKLADMGDRVPIGEGWARRVYEHQGQALKIATGPRGILQNQGEAMLRGRSDVLNPFIGHAPDHSWVLQELATPFESSEDMSRHLGMAEHSDFGQWLRDVIAAERPPAGMSPQAQEFWDRLQQLYREVPELDARDLGKYQQWGFDKHGRHVLIDYGFLKGMHIAVAGGLGLSAGDTQK